MGAIVFVLWRTLQLMPRTKPQQIKPQAKLADRLGRHRRRRRGEGRAARGRRVPEGPAALQEARREGAARDPAPRPARAPARRCSPRPSRTSRARTSSRSRPPSFVEMFAGARRGAHPAPLQGRAQERAGDHLHRRARRRRRPCAAPTTSRARRTRRSTSCWSRWTASPTRDDVVVIAASNLLEKLDPALLRPGRFDRQVFVVAARRQGPRADPRRPHARQAAGRDVDLG